MLSKEYRLHDFYAAVYRRSLSAYNYLQTLPDPEFVFEPIFGDPEDTAANFHRPLILPARNPRHIATNFPNSKFATWANFCVATTFLAFNENKSFGIEPRLPAELEGLCLEVLAEATLLQKNARETLKVHMSILYATCPRVHSNTQMTVPKLCEKEFTYDLK